MTQGARYLLALAAIVSACNREQQARDELQRINRQVAADAVASYEIAKRAAVPMDMCVHAGMVSAAFLQAHNETSYTAWKKTEAADCASAGVPK